MLTLVPMPASELESWLPGSWDDYLSERLISGEDAEAAKRNVQATQGTIWLKEPQDELSSVWFLYDIVIDERFRGDGYGRRGMETAENWVRERGGTRLALNVFGHNSVARGLYDSLGYRTQAIQMFKDL
jgi:GNAT superfamily N-acetyltransferase